MNCQCHIHIMKLQQNITNQVNNDEQLSPVLDKLRQDDQGFKVPDGYFDSLSSSIVDRIQKQESKSFSGTLIHLFRKPLVWAPSLASVVVVLLLIFVIPAKKNSMNQPTDEWVQINMAYDPSYAEEIVLAESNTIDKELESREIKYYDPASMSAKNEPTDAEINEYLKDHVIESDVLNQY